MHRISTAITLLLPLTLLGGDPKSALEQQLEAAKLQREAAHPRSPAGQFFQTAWLHEENPPLAAQTGDCAKIPDDELQALISRIPLEGVSSTLVRAIVDQESAGKPCAVSSKGAMGLMQIMPDLASDMKVADPFDPEQNLRAGIKYLVQLTSRYRGDLPRILAAYNAGPARVDSLKPIPEIPETQDYVRSILGKLDQEFSRTRLDK
jgi:soluble lytic murein transglycosylase-like protein